MHITFLKTVEPPDAHTTFRKGRTFSMPESMAQGFIKARVARLAGLPQAESAAATQPLIENEEDDTPLD